MNLISPTNSIRQNLYFQLALVAAVLSFAFLFAVRTVAYQAAEDTQDNILAASAASIAEAVYLEKGEVRLELPYSALAMLGTVSDDRVFYNVLSEGKSLTGYADLPMIRAETPAVTPIFDTITYRGDQIRLVAITRQIGTSGQQRQISVHVGQTRNGLAVISGKITSRATLIGAAFFVVSILLSAVAARTALSPLERLADAVGRRGPNDLRPVATPTPLELQPLVNGLNNFMDRLGAALNRSEDLIVEAAHRIRTPLATVRTQAEVIHRMMNRPENRQSLREMIRAVDDSSRSAGQLLDHAMVNFRSEHVSPQRLDPKALLNDTIDRLAPTAGLKDIEIKTAIDEGTYFVNGDPILLQNALSNVLDNAIKYSPEETEIIAGIELGNPGRIFVSDQGSGFDESEIGSLSGRFSRGSNVGNIVGSGLGLTIAKDVAKTHGGKLTIANNSNGVGACVSLSLPFY